MGYYLLYTLTLSVLVFGTGKLSFGSPKYAYLMVVRADGSNSALSYSVPMDAADSNT